MSLARALRHARHNALAAALAFETAAFAQDPDPVRLRVRVDPSVSGCIGEERLRLGLREVLVNGAPAPSDADTPEELLVEVVRNGDSISGTLAWLPSGGEARDRSTPITVPRRACAELRGSLVLALRVWLQNTPRPSAHPDARRIPTEQTDRQTGSQERPDPAESPRPDVARDPPPPLPRPQARTPIGLSLIAAGTVGDTPTLSLGLGVGLRYGRDRWRAAVSLHWSRELGVATTSRSDVSIAIDRWSAALRGCVGTIAVGGCLVADAGLLVANLSGAALPKRSLPATLAVGAGAEVVLSPRSGVALRLYLDVLITVVGAILQIQRGPSAEDPWSSPSAWVVVGVAPTWQP